MTFDNILGQEVATLMMAIGTHIKNEDERKSFHKDDDSVEVSCVSR